MSLAQTSPRQRKTTGRVMHEFTHGELRSGRGGKGGKVKNRRQAIAIALKEAGASKYESASKNKRNLARSERKEARGETYQQEHEGNPMSVPVVDAKAAERWVVKTRLEELQGAERPPGHERDEAGPNKTGKRALFAVRHLFARPCRIGLNCACLSKHASKKRLPTASSDLKQTCRGSAFEGIC
jgi:Family of unknown function (DUF6496)